MVAPVANRSIVRLPPRVLPALRGVVEISSFAIGKERLGPAITSLFQRLGITPKGIYLDNPAKIRLLGMKPSLEKRTELFEAAEVIFSSLKLSAFLAQDQTLFILGNKENIDLMARGAAAPAATASRPQIVLPEMIAISNNLAIMKAEVTVELFKRVMEGYSITGPESNKLKELLNDPSRAKTPVTYVNLLNAIEFARRLSDLTGRKFRVPIETEWFQERAQLDGLNFTWTMTESSEKNIFVLCLLSDGVDPGYRRNEAPGVRAADFSIRLVEDVLPEAPAARPPVMGLYDRCLEENKLNDLANGFRYDNFGTSASNLKYLEAAEAAAGLAQVGQDETKQENGRAVFIVDEILETMLKHNSLEEMARVMHQLALNHPDYALPLFQRLANKSACVIVAVQNLLSKEASELLGVLLKGENGRERIASLLARCPVEIVEEILPQIDLLEAAANPEDFESSW